MLPHHFFLLSSFLFLKLLKLLSLISFPLHTDHQTSIYLSGPFFCIVDSDPVDHHMYRTSVFFVHFLIMCHHWCHMNLLLTTDVTTCATQFHRPLIHPLSYHPLTSEPKSTLSHTGHRYASKFIVRLLFKTLFWLESQEICVPAGQVCSIFFLFRNLRPREFLLLMRFLGYI